MWDTGVHGISICDFPSFCELTAEEESGPRSMMVWALLLLASLVRQTQGYGCAVAPRLGAVRTRRVVASVAADTDQLSEFRAWLTSNDLASGKDQVQFGRSCL